MYDTKTRKRLHSATKSDAPHFFLRNLSPQLAPTDEVAGAAGASPPLLQIEVSHDMSASFIACLDS